MFIVDDPDTAKAILHFYENPDHNSWRDELEQRGLLETVEPYAKKAMALTVDDFIKNERWGGISLEMDKYLPTVIRKGENFPIGEIDNFDVLRAVSISSCKPITDVKLLADKLEWFIGRTPGFKEFTIDINPGMPLVLAPFNQIVVATNTKPNTINAMYTFIPPHIIKKLKNKQVIVPSQGSDYYFYKGVMETI